jgi:peroxiredoxin
MSDKSCTETLNLGDVAPAFTLSAANRPDAVTLENLLKQGPAIVEFLRGTW